MRPSPASPHTSVESPRRSTAATARRTDIAALVVGVLVLTASSIAATAPLTSAEIDLFRFINDQPQSLYPFIWPLMQYGTFVTIPLLSLVALGFRRYRAAIVMATSGIGVYLIAKVVKVAVERPRPAALLTGVHEREVFGEGSLGYPSGHAAVAAALAFTCAMFFGVVWFRIGLALAIIVSVGRLYVGAHLPLDVVGGAALGVIAGALAHLLIGLPRVHESLADDAEPLVEEAAPSRDIDH
jgi:membrane-associated phospholipid phosphatase